MVHTSVTKDFHKSAYRPDQELSSFSISSGRELVVLHTRPSMFGKF